MNSPLPADRRTAVAGILSIALGLAGAVVDRMWTFPGTSATGPAVAAFVADHRPELIVAMVLNTTAVALWLVFGLGVHARLRAITGADDEHLLLVYAAGLVVFITLLLAGFTAFWLLLAHSGQAQFAGPLYDQTFGLLAMSGIPTALCLGAFAKLAGRTRAFSTGSVWLAVAGAIAHLALLSSFAVNRGFFSLEGGVIIAIPGTLFAWILATSVILLRSPTPYPRDA